MTGKIIVSLDCEGKWGMADVINSSHNAITQERLRSTYNDLLKLFSEYNVKATFAFVGAFTLRENERSRYLHDEINSTYNGKNWFKNYLLFAKENNSDGWFCPEAWDMVAESGHELASHGFSHIPYNEGNANITDLKEDIEKAVQLSNEKGHSLKTFVYPRNQVGHQKLLEANGFLGYRECLKSTKHSRFLSELNIFARSEGHLEPCHGLTRIPSGHVFNRRSGARGKIPMTITTNRWKSILLDAIQRNQVAHLWLHPHNLITSPSTMLVLRDVIKFIGQQQHAGKITSFTQLEYTKDRNHII